MLTIEEVAAFYKVQVQTLYEWRKKKYGPPARRIGKHLRYKADEVETWFD
ncbi:helix-turn-helix transcriptional regulator [Saccharopolyspora erythraea]